MQENNFKDKIFVVNDNYNVLILIKTLLEESGFNDVELFGNGNEALLKLSAVRPDLVISDICMPVVDGFQMLREIKASADPRIKNIPVILYSATFNDFETRRMAGELGAVSFFNVPFDEAAFIAEVTKVLNAGRPASQKSQSQLSERGETAQESAIRLFILEDDIFVSKFLTHALKDLKYSIRTVSTVADFWLEFTSFKPHVCILDYNLPDGSGMDVLKKVKSDTPSVKAILMTALSNERMIDDFIKEGADGFINKPVNVRRLIEAVKTAADDSMKVTPEAVAESAAPPVPLEDAKHKSVDYREFFMNAPMPFAVLDDCFGFIEYNNEFGDFLKSFEPIQNSQARRTGKGLASFMSPQSYNEFSELVEKFRDNAICNKLKYSFKTLNSPDNKIEVTMIVNIGEGAKKEYRLCIEKIKPVVE